MIYLLDANAVIALMNNSNAALAQRTRSQRPADIGISAIVTHELYYGAYKSRQVAQNLTRVEALRFAVLEFDQEDARQAGEVRALLTIQGRLIGPYDLLIAGQARARGLVLVTHNTREFERVPGLQVEDWEIGVT